MTADFRSAYALATLVGKLNFRSVLNFGAPLKKKNPIFGTQLTYYLLRLGQYKLYLTILPIFYLFYCVQDSTN